MATQTEKTAAQTGTAPGTGEDRADDGSTTAPADNDRSAPDRAVPDRGDGEPGAEGDGDGTGSGLVEGDEPGADDGTGPSGRGASQGVGAGAAAVVSAALAVVSLSGGWLGTVASARQSVIGQLEAAGSGGDVARQVEIVYGDAWQAAALVGGLFALVALVIGAVVVARPAFGTPGPERAPWIASVAWAGVVLGAVGLLLAIAKYTDLLLGLPSVT
ncbi:hypothetical protein JNUCC64_08625 [Streptomyces sp. JNUCC 64]